MTRARLIKRVAHILSALKQLISHTSGHISFTDLSISLAKTILSFYFTMPEKTVACQSCETEISGTGRLNQKFFHCHTCVTQRGPRNFDNRTWTDCTSDLESHANHFVPLTADPNSRAGNGPRCQAAKSGGPIFQRLTVAHNAYCQRG